jgi:hypothetical protein
MTDFSELHQVLLKAGKGLSHQFWNPANRLSMNNYPLKSRQHSGHDFWEQASGNFTGFEKLSAYSKAFGAKRLMTYWSRIKLMTLLKNYEYLPDSLNQGLSNHTT